MTNRKSTPGGGAKGSAGGGGGRLTPKVKTPEALTAERLAALIEAAETPRPVRELLKLACMSIDIFSAERVGGGEYDFQFPPVDELTPALIRRKLPRMLRRVGAWRLADTQAKELEAPE